MSGVSVRVAERQTVSEMTYLAVEDLDVYRKPCQLHLEVCGLTHAWPAEERYELESQVRRSSNSAPAQWLRRLTTPT